MLQENNSSIVLLDGPSSVQPSETRVVELTVIQLYFRTSLQSQVA